MTIMLFDFADKNKTRIAQGDADELAASRSQIQVLESKQELLTTLLSDVTDAVITTNPVGIVTYMNPSAEVLTGCDAQYAFGKQATAIFRVVDQRTRKETNNPVSLAFQRCTPIELGPGAALITPSGQESPVTGLCSPQWGHNEEIVGMTIVFRVRNARTSQMPVQPSEDVLAAKLEIQTLQHEAVVVAEETQRAAEQAKVELNGAKRETVKLTAELHKAEEAAAEAGQQTGELLKVIGDQIAPPSASVVRSSETLRSDLEDLNVSSVTPDVDIIHSAGTYMRRVANDIRDLSRIESGQAGLFLESFDVPEMIEEIAANQQSSLETSGNQLKADCPRNIGEIYADRIKVRQSLIDIVSHACSMVTNRMFALSATRESEWILFHLTDAGPGGDAGNSVQPLAVFDRTNLAEVRKHWTTGVRLEVARRFCQMMGGDMILQGEAGHGLTFTLKIPAIVKEEASKY